MVLSKPDRRLRDKAAGNRENRNYLKVPSQISPEGEIIVKIEPDVSTITGLNQDGFPIVTSRKATSTIRVQNGKPLCWEA